MEYGQKAEFIRNSKRVIGVNLGADVATEHECGIGPILDNFQGRSNSRVSFGPRLSEYEQWQLDMANRGFIKRIQDLWSKGDKLEGLPLPAFGVDKLKISHLPDGEFGLRWIETSRSAGFGYGIGTRNPEQADPNWKDDDLVGAWDDRSFMVLGRTKQTQKKLRKIYEQFERKNIMFKLSPGFLMSGGLCILMVDGLPTDYKEELYETHYKKFIGEHKLAKTGIKEKLKASGKRWFALSRYHETPEGTWIVWLNPCEQRIHRAGWYTVEDLELWAQDKGPVMCSKHRKCG